MPIIKSKLEEITGSYGAGMAGAIATLALLMFLFINWLMVGFTLWLLSFGWSVFAITWSQTFPVSIAWLFVNLGSVKGK